MTSLPHPDGRADAAAPAGAPAGAPVGPSADASAESTAEARASYVLRFSCPNQVGIVAAVTSTLVQLGCDITDGQQFDDRLTGTFFGRIEFDALRNDLGARGFYDGMTPVLTSFGATWGVRAVGHRGRVLIMASQYDHCLVDLLYRWRIGELPMDIVAIVANHPRDTYRTADLGDIPFHHLPVTPQTKAEQEAIVWRLIEELDVDLVILARYMQILSAELAGRLHGRCINIHHSFLPGFKGAKPYHQAYERGVKLIGATAHYVTSELDEGPIIAQDVERVTHRHRPDDLVRTGRDIERRVLAQAVRAHLEDRVMLRGRTTVVFPS